MAIFGGRIDNNGRQVADLLAEHTGFPVVLLDFFRGVSFLQTRHFSVLQYYLTLPRYY